MRPDAAGIEIAGLTKTLGGAQVLHRVDLRASPGEVTGFLGPNGAGKSTTLRCLLGLYSIDAGTAHINGCRYDELPKPTGAVGAVLDPLTVNPSMSGRDHLRVYAAMGGHPDERVDACIQALSMQNYALRPSGSWSTGMRQRLSIATALLGDPQAVVLDEPTNGLDPEGIQWVLGFLRGLAERGRTVVISSHVLAEIEPVLDCAVIIRNGRTVASGTLATLARETGASSLEEIYAHIARSAS